ncbi:pentapeptide repeat-containing protein [Zooshikella marina]|uniref:pentapeptide repeat-containing protein n=1 Tax=Zooshikella ganghwensis TaxID=202772 RepID=UPI001BB03D98|nr:pentapeptide repeat-containing protein [Zooshikella ganghwensis]MBU2708788.1 pentapeptide repeat-containing protein [Zooshikella ganghwensis]
MNEMVSSPTKAKVSLGPDEAVGLWLQGKEVWNKWVEENPVADVSFSNVDFNSHCKGLGPVDFSGFFFPFGKVSFEGSTFNNRQMKRSVHFTMTKFGKSEVSFYGARFGNGHVDFSGAQFGGEGVTFERSKFGKGDISFYNAQFGNGNVSFEKTIFGEGNVSFDGAEFGEGEISFLMAQFGNGRVSFEEVIFGRGNIDFYEVDFGNGNVSFRNAKFGEGNVVFIGAKFGEGDVSFNKVHFYNKHLVFDNAKFSEGELCFSGTLIYSKFVSFAGAEFKGELNFSPEYVNKGYYTFEDIDCYQRVNFTSLWGDQKIIFLSFRFSNFNKSFRLAGSFNCIPDLTHTKVSHKVTVHGLRCNLKRSGFFRKAEDPEDEARLRRLKDIAEDNKDHESALAFHANEMRARRWHNAGFWASILDLLFDKTSNYGQSVYLPSMWLLGLNLWVILLFYIPWPSTLEKVGEAFKLSAINTFPFISGAKDIRSNSIQELFCSAGTSPLTCTTPDAVFIIQGLLSFIFLFLIGLGLRNRFRI